MSKDTKRLKIIRELIEKPIDLEKINISLNSFDWDYEGECILLHRKNLMDIFDRYLSKEVDGNFLKNWADIVELREEVEYENGYEDLMGDIISSLSAPEINGDISERIVHKYLKLLD